MYISVYDEWNLIEKRIILVSMTSASVSLHFARCDKSDGLANYFGAAEVSHVAVSESMNLRLKKIDEYCQVSVPKKLSNFHKAKSSESSTSPLLQFTKIYAPLFS